MHPEIIDNVNKASPYPGANCLEDLKKARKNLDWLIEELEKN
jgi:hypothetical protein